MTARIHNWNGHANNWHTSLSTAVPNCTSFSLLWLGYKWWSFY